MNPSPAEQWLREQAVRLSGRLPQGTLQDTLLEDPAFTPASVRNPVPRPPAVQFPAWFDARDTAAGQSLASTLGSSSGYFQEYLSWAPPVSWLFDCVANLIQLLVHPGTPFQVRDALFPYAHSLVSIVEQTTALLQVHQIHAKHHGTPLEGTWKAVQTQIRLQGTANTFSSEIIGSTLDKINKELLTAQLKSVSKAEAQRGASSRPHEQSGRSRGRNSYNRGRDNRRDPPPAKSA